MSEAGQLSEAFARKFPDAVAILLARGDTAESAEFLNELPPAVAASVAARLPARTINALLAGGIARPESWLARASFDDAVVLLGPLPRERCLAFINGLQDQTLQRRLLQFINYPPHSVGAVVSDTVVGIKADLPIADVMAELQALHADSAPPLVLLDADGRYAGVLNVWQLLVREALVGRGADYAVWVMPLRAEAPIASAAQAEQWESHNWLPVVDHGDRVLGTVSRQRLLHSVAASPEAGPILQDSIADLGVQLLRVLTDLMGRILTPRSTP